MHKLHRTSLGESETVLRSGGCFRQGGAALGRQEGGHYGAMFMLLCCCCYNVWKIVLWILAFFYSAYVHVHECEGPLKVFQGVSL